MRHRFMPVQGYLPAPSWAGTKGGQVYQNASRKKMAVVKTTANQKITIACCGSALHANCIMIG